MKASRRATLGRRRAGGALFAVALVSLAFGGCAWLQPLPPDYPLPSPAGNGIRIQCPFPGHGRDRTPHTSRLSFDAGLKNWVGRDGAFADRQPITAQAVRATDVHPRWTSSQRATFPDDQPADAHPSLVPLGGDYWRGTPYPIVSEGAGPWVSSAYASGASGGAPEFRGDPMTGSIWTPLVFDARYLRAEIGGDDDARVGVELLVEPGTGNDTSGCGGAAQEMSASWPPVKGFESYARVAVLRARGDQEAVESYELPIDVPGCRLRGLRAVLRIFDFSPERHINVGSIELADESQGASMDSSGNRPAAPVWGFADFHAHPTDYLGFGGLQGLHTLWGAPGGSIHEYVRPGEKANAAANRDLPPCDAPKGPLHFNGHHGGFAAPLMLNVAENRTSADLDDVAQAELSDEHPSEGSPIYSDHPDFRRGSHEQYHITQIHRAYLGGLRLMTALAVHNRGLEYGAGWVTCSPDGRPTVDTTADLDVVRAHVEAMRQLTALNGDWMEIAYTPQRAREIIRENKLAVVLGVEVAQLGEEPGRTIEQQVSELDDLGIRQVILVHGMDNLLGGTALFVDLYNAVNDWMHRDPRVRDEVLPLSGILKPNPFGGATFFEVTTTPGPETDPVNEPILFRLGNPYRIVLSDLAPRPSPFTHNIPLLNKPFGPLHPLIGLKAIYEKARGPYDDLPPGHRNKRGLSGLGRDFVKTVIEHGMVLDLSHLSDESLDGAYKAADESCESYPLVVSHAHFRRLGIKNDYSDRVSPLLDKTSATVRRDLLAGRFPMNACIRDHGKCDRVVLDAATASSQQPPLHGPGTVDPGNLPREFDLSTYEVDQLSRRRGAIGVFLGQGAIDSAPVDPLRNDCAGSSKSFVAALLYAQKHMAHGAIGVASDFTQIATVAPRFGDNACSGYAGAGHGSGSAAQLLETLVEPGQYRLADQRDPVLYRSGVATCVAGAPDKQRLDGVPCGTNAPLEPYRLGSRVYDFNVDGLAHYGMVPDMLQDASNVLGSDERRESVFARVFGSAEGYIEAWQAARSMAGCGAGGPCSPPPTATHPEACGDLCPCSWNGGAPLQLLDERFGVCETGRPIRLPTVDRNGSVFDGKAKYQQRRAHPGERGDLTQQGDWAVFPIGPHPTWRCGDGPARALLCPSSANYVKVRRVLDTTVRSSVPCDWQELPPEVGNRRIVFQCLAGPPDGELPRTCP